ncbi:MAG TPA: O-antigen ligase family protein [Daejeonella sp.]|uniref:O-antigen ligase family protein n=1 Tax=Daejeonella sp. TaxID=2805397 RepID=UPI002EDA850D
MIRLDILKYLLPLFLISPMLTLGGFGLTIAEILTFFTGIVFLMGFKGTIKFPAILILFIFLIVVGRIGAFVNSLDYNIPFNYAKIVFLFIIFVQVISYSIGRYSKITFDEIIVSGFAKVLFSVLAVFSLIYIVSDFDTRVRLLTLFFPKGMDFVRFNSPRFPGLGINANIYSFIVFMFLVMSVRTYLENKSNFLIPFLCTVIIFSITSKTTIIVSMIALLFFSIYYYSKKTSDNLTKKKATRIITTLILIGFIIITASIVFSEYIIIFQRFDELLGNSENVNSLNDRFELWNLGIERIKMAPFFGIDVVQANLVSDTRPIYFATPHNEFLFYWMSLGIAGLLAYSILLIYLVWINLFPKIRIEWIIIYSALIIQMFFDGAFQTLRFQFIFFIFLGLNFRELAIERTKDYDFKLQ